MNEKKKNMYGDAKGGVSNVFVGCLYECKYCETSFKRQMKRKMPVINKLGRKQGCQDCYDYTPHFHPERLGQSLPRTEGDEFIWLIRSGDPAFMSPSDLNRVLDVMRLKTSRIDNTKKTFLLQSKNPIMFELFDLPKNLIIGTTIESNRDHNISKAPMEWNRKQGIETVEHPRKSITIEPIMKFDLDILFQWIDDIKPERVYIGYDSGNSKLPEPTLTETNQLIYELEQITKVKPKLLRKAWDEV